MKKFLLWLAAILVVVVVALGLYGVFGPVQVAQAGYGTDDACMRALKQRDVPYAQRVDRCRIRVVAVSSVRPSGIHDGYFRWRVGNEIWRFYVEVTWSPRLSTPTSAPVWRIDDVNCWKSYVYIVGLDISSCGAWRRGDDHLGGATYVTSFGPVAVGARTYLIVNPDGSTEGPIYD
jgi:hypothetical protein